MSRVYVIKHDSKHVTDELRWHLIKNLELKIDTKRTQSANRIYSLWKTFPKN